MGCPYPASTLWAEESLWNAVILSDLTKFMYFCFSGFLLLFTESSIALERARLQNAALVSNFYVLYHRCFLTRCIACSKVSGNGCILNWCFQMCSKVIPLPFSNIQQNILGFKKRSNPSPEYWIPPYWPPKVNRSKHIWYLFFGDGFL